MFTGEVFESEATWFDGSIGKLVHELLDMESPLFVPPHHEVVEGKQVACQKSIIDKLIPSVYPGPTIGDIESALSMSYQHGPGAGSEVMYVR